MVSYDNWIAVVINPWKVSRKWVRLTRILGREKADAWTLGHIYLAVVQLVNILRVRDVGYDSMHWEGVGQIPPQGGPKDDGEETLEREGRHVDIPPAGIRDVGGGPIGGG